MASLIYYIQEAQSHEGKNQRSEISVKPGTLREGSEELVNLGLSQWELHFSHKKKINMDGERRQSKELMEKPLVGKGLEAR